MSKLIPLMETLFLNKGANAQLWIATNEVILNKTDEGRNFCLFMKTKLRDMNQQVQLLALDFLDYSVDKGKMPLWTQVGSKDFIMSLITLLKTRDVPDVQSKILFLIDKWSRKFEQYKEILPLYKEIHTNLKNAGVVFPLNIQSTYHKYLNCQSQGQLSSGSSNEGNKKRNASTVCNYASIYESIALHPNKYEKKYKKLVEKLMECIDNIIVSNEMIDTGNSDESLTNITIELRKSNTKLIETISSDKLKDEKLMEICLGIIEDVNKTIKRYDELKEGRFPEVFESYINGNSEIKGKEKEIERSPLDIFGGFEPQEQQQEQKNNDSNSKNVNHNDLFDIFSNPQPIGNNNVNGINMQMNMPMQMGNNINNNGGMSIDLFTNFDTSNHKGQSHSQIQDTAAIVNLFDQMNQPSQMNNDNKHNILTEQLKMAYNNNNNSNNNINNNGNIGMIMPNNNNNNQIMNFPRSNSNSNMNPNVQFQQQQNPLINMNINNQFSSQSDNDIFNMGLLFNNNNNQSQSQSQPTQNQSFQSNYPSLF